MLRNLRNVKRKIEVLHNQYHDRIKIVEIPSILNDIPQEILITKGKKNFKVKLKEFLLKRSYNNNK